MSIKKNILTDLFAFFSIIFYNYIDNK